MMLTWKVPLTMGGPEMVPARIEVQSGRQRAGSEHRGTLLAMIV